MSKSEKRRRAQEAKAQAAAQARRAAEGASVDIPAAKPTNGQHETRAASSETANPESRSHPLRNTNVWIVIFTAVLALTGIVQWRTSDGQLKQMEGQLTEMKQSTIASVIAANAAKSAAETAAASAREGTEQFAVGARPYVVVRTAKLTKTLSFGNPLQADVTWINAGRTPALKLQMLLRIGLRKEIPNDPGEWEDSAHNQPSSLTLGPGIETIASIKGDKPLTEEVIESIRKGTLKLCVFGSVVYQSVFDKKTVYATDICFFYRPEGVDPEFLFAAKDGNDVR